MEQPPGFVDKDHPDHVCLLKRSLYGLKQAPRQWFQRLSTFLSTIGFRSSKADTSLFIHTHGAHHIFILCYVDDIIITGSNLAIVDHCITQIQHEFPVKDLGSLHYFLGMEVQHLSNGLLLSQSTYIQDLLHKTGMDGAKGCLTPMATVPNLSKQMGTLLPNGDEYRSLVPYNT